MNVKVDLSNIGIDSDAIEKMRSLAMEKLDALFGDSDEHLESAGWVDYPNRLSVSDIAHIEGIAAEIRRKSDVLVVLGVGGSYMGAKSLIDIVPGDSDTEVIFSGYDFSARYFRDVINSLKEKSFSICAISKSGSTMETMAAFAIMRDVLVGRYGEKEAARRTYVITVNDDNPLRRRAMEIDATILDMPSDIGGRYSVLTPAGLLPAAVHGIDVRSVVAGAKAIASKDEFLEVIDYAIVRNILLEQGKRVEVFEFFDPYAEFFGNWLQQLFGESEGKDGKGLYPAKLTFNRDLHSMGQFLQEGMPIFFETMLLLGKQKDELVIPETTIVPHLSNQKVADISSNVEKGVIEAHRKAGIPLITISIDEITPSTMGELMYFFMVQCAVSALILGVNPFNQPGVEAYKSEVKRLIKE